MAAERNLELKMVAADLGATAVACTEVGAEDHGDLRQRDTYFHAVKGRLKLREAPPGPAELISYLRADQEGPKVSNYRVVTVYDPVGLADALGDALGVRVVVEKVRRLFTWRNVRVHLDRVAGLGHFVELEAVAATIGGLEAERVKLEELRRTLGLEHTPLVARGYADLVERQPRVALRDRPRAGP